MGLVFQISSRIPKDNITISGSFFFYYRVFPTYEEQNRNNTKEVDKAVNSEDILEETEEIIEPNWRSVRLVFKKSDVVNFKVDITPDDLQFDSNFRATKAEVKINSIIKKEIAKVIKNIELKEMNIWRRMEKRNQIMFLTNATEDDYNNIEEKFNEFPTVKPIIKVEVQIEESYNYISSINNVKITIKNTQQIPKKLDFNTESTIFDVFLQIESPSKWIVETELNFFDKEYIQNGRTIAKPINCSISSKSTINKLMTDHTPVFKDKRKKATAYGFEHFEDLSDKDTAIPVLRKLLIKMKEFLKYRRSEFKDSNFSNIKREIRSFEDSLIWFTKGIELLESNSTVLEAFCLLNQTMKSSVKYKGWYTYQIVYIVSGISDLVAAHDPSIENKRIQVDLIWFPTGGGKTEAYLGLVVLQLFIDRLFGKKSGVSAIFRFPMRILTLQQIRRIHALISNAEKIRMEHPKIKNSEPFRIGYFTGNSTTPNVIIKSNYNSHSLNRLVNLEQNYTKSMLVIQECKFCGSENKIELKRDIENIRFELVCNECKTNQNVLLTDEEIYRYLPSLIVSTIDKFAAGTWRRQFRNIFGGTTYRCPKHGYGLNNGCWYKNFNDRDYKCTIPFSDYDRIDSYFLGATLLIQDEIHLIRDQVGSFASHYEGLIHTVIEEFSKLATGHSITPKVVASTATIEQYKSQIRNLYLRDGLSFPPRLPERENSDFTFFMDSKTDEIGRYIVGIRPRGTTLIFALQHLIQARETVFQDLWKAKEYPQNELLRHLLTLSYNQRIADADQLAYSLESMVNQELRSQGYDRIPSVTLTGDIGMDKILDVMGAVEDLTNSNLDLEPRLINATKLISVGVDISGINTVIFRGMPKDNAEYIQAMSRGGRSTTGLVFTLYDHTRERDISYYRYFYLFHKLFEYLIDPVPLNRWAKYGIKRTLPGIFAFTIYGLIEGILNFNVKDQKSYTELHLVSKLSKAFSQKKVSRDEILSYIYLIYARKSSLLNEELDEYIRNEFEKLSDRVERATSQNAYIASATSESESSKKIGAMTSLRDIEKSVNIGCYDLSNKSKNFERTSIVR